MSPLQAQDLHITLLNGDCDGDNEVTLFDFGTVVNAFGSTPNDPNWDPRADLDGDLEVTLFDYGMVLRHFGAIGAEPFDPALPRQPAPSEGYALSGMVTLEAWEGGPLTVRIEALREDDPAQMVYWFLQDWLSFGVAEIGGTPPRYDDWKPRSKGHGDDRDALSNKFETRMQSRFYCAPPQPFQHHRVVDRRSGW